MGYKSETKSPVSALLLSALLLSAGLCCSAAFATPSGGESQSAGAPPLRQVNGESLSGVASPTRGVDAFLGVPFAKPPVGDLRWRAPVAYVGAGGTRAAQSFAPACMQSMRILDWYRGMAQRFGAAREVFADLPISEDCLYLNVWAPSTAHKAALPVMVFLHGGSNRSGWSFEPNYHGHRLAELGVVVVSVAYRLGVFGFFSHPQLAGQNAVANFGLWDQIEALRWVQKNISQFGGDPQRVTVFGESSGAGNIGALMLSPAAQGLLQRAILQSGGDFGLPGVRSLAAEQQRGLRLAAAIDRDAPPDLAKLRQLDAAALLLSAESVFRDHYHAPVEDGVIVKSPERALAAGNIGVQQLLIGTNANEYYSSDNEGLGSAAIDTAVAAAEVLNTPAVRAELQDTTNVALALDRLATADSMLCPAQALAAAIAKAGRPVWMYRFSRVREGAAAAALRAYHGAELPYVFGTHDTWLPTSKIDERLTLSMMQSWVQFARSGTPQIAALPRWPAYASAGRGNVLDWNAATTVIDTPEPVLCRIYRERLARSASQ